MGSFSQLKREFIKKWAKGLQTYTSSKKEMSFLERQKAIKLSADVAMAASTRIKATTTTSWSCALIAKAKLDDKNAVVVENILGPDDDSTEKLWKCNSNQLGMCHKRVRSKKILKKSCGISKRARRMAPNKMTVLATCVAKRLVKKRTQVLKSLVPGGESMDELSLIKETLDYIISLRVQVDVMRRLANATEVLNCKKMDDGTI